MEDNTNLLDSLFEKATDYGITSFELIKLKALDKSTDIVSSLIPLSVFILLIASFLLFLNLGIAFWLGEMLGKIFYGFFLVAAFYILAGIIIHFFLNEWFKKLVGNYFVKHMLK
jgi:hypothetical protein